jgi:hypothetical protein
MTALTEWLAKHYEERGSAVWLALGLELFARLVLCAMMLLTCADKVMHHCRRPVLVVPLGLE